MLPTYWIALTVTKGKPLARGENYVVDTGGEKKTTLELCQKEAKSVWVLSSEYVFLLFSPILEKMLEKQKSGISKGFCFLLHPAFKPLRGVYLPCRKEERDLGSWRRSDIALPSVRSTAAGDLAVSLWLLLSTSWVVNICCTFAPQCCGKLQRLSYL